MFEKLPDSTLKEQEKKIREYWKEIDLLNKTVQTREGKKEFVFYEGPPTANGKPGIHHVISRTLKDMTCRFNTMHDKKVLRKAGWDCHGLPVELEVEKKLGLKNKQDIEEYGIEEFNKKCKESVWEYLDLWTDMTERMAYLIDLDNPYVTMDTEYVESVWHILNRFFKEGYIYKGHKILPYCPRCGTGLASHEVAQGYKEIKSNTVTAKFKLVEKENEYFLAWTTTPWTLASNVSLTVHADIDYIKVKQKDEVYYIAKELANKVLGEDYEVLQELKGKELENIEYEQLMPFVQADKKAFYVTVADYVTTTDGTGIVHTAPAFGEDDYNTGRRYELPVLQPVDDTGKYTHTPWKGRFVIDEELSVDIIKYLASENKLYSKHKMEHNYPHCWRCSTPLIYYAKPSWYIEMTKLKDKLIQENNKVNWHPSHTGQKRFGNWLENLNDWAISRSRYWGTPLNLWTCPTEGCNHLESVGSIDELIEKSVDKIDRNDVDLHRPFVDNIKIKCEKCNAEMTREKDVIDCWFDSGSMPYAQHHYPMENKDNFFEEKFPADFICEGIDQTRGWFYSLIAISTFIAGQSPYKSVLVNDLILDKNGHKMSKSKGNTVDPFELFDEYGADSLRWYILYVSSPWLPTRFDIDGLKEVHSKFFSTLKNVYNFFSMYSLSDKIDARNFDIPVEERPELDRWIISKYNNLIDYVEKEFENYEVTKIVRAIQEFVNEILSNWYIRRSRRRFWQSELTFDKKSVFRTTYEILTGLSKMIAPFAPYTAEMLYQNLTEGQSVHIDYYPKSNKDYIDNALENRMDIVRELVSLGRAARENASIKVRQPISSVLVDKKFQDLINDDFENLIKEELNVKKIEFAQNVTEYVDLEIKPNFKVLGPVLGKNINNFAKSLSSLSDDLVVELKNGNELEHEFEGNNIVLNDENIEIRIKAKEGYKVESNKDMYVVLDTNLTCELISEGYSREVVSKVQQIRKNLDLDVLDNINVILETDNEDLINAVEKFKDYICKETLASEVSLIKKENDEFKINDAYAGIKVDKV